ncbi:MAG: helix-turn-helix transcriptional regulator [Clostridia bacterium]|nr:helix-turn-helix transcriptional regulator [Clostridia bacterium]
MTFAERIKLMRTRMGLTQAQVADAIGAERTTYTYYEKGRNEPSMDRLVLLAKIFGTDVGTLVGENDIPSSEFGIADDSVDYGAEFDKVDELKKDEKMLLLYYRRLEDGQKAKFIRKIAEKHGK